MALTKYNQNRSTQGSGTPVLFRVIAVFSFDPSHVKSDDIASSTHKFMTFQNGDVIDIVRGVNTSSVSNYKQWLKGQNERTGEIGWLPSNYVQYLNKEYVGKFIESIDNIPLFLAKNLMMKVLYENKQKKQALSLGIGQADAPKKNKKGATLDIRTDYDIINDFTKNTSDLRGSSRLIKTEIQREEIVKLLSTPKAFVPPRIQTYDVFDVNYELLLKKSNRSFPIFLDTIFECLMTKNALVSEGLFRVSANKTEMDTAIEIINADETYDFGCKKNPDLAAGILKKFVSRMPDPLFTANEYCISILKDALETDFKLYTKPEQTVIPIKRGYDYEELLKTSSNGLNAFADTYNIFDICDENKSLVERCNKWADVLKICLPFSRLIFLIKLFTLLRMVADNVEENKMTTSNIMTIVGMHLVCNPISKKLGAKDPLSAEADNSKAAIMRAAETLKADGTDGSSTFIRDLPKTILDLWPGIHYFLPKLPAINKPIRNLLKESIETLSDPEYAGKSHEKVMRDYKQKLEEIKQRNLKAANENPIEKKVQMTFEVIEKYAIVVADFKGDSEKKLTVKAGDRVFVEKSERNGWLLVKLNHTKGWIPYTFINYETTDNDNI